MRHFRFLYIFEILSKEKENTINLVDDIEGKTNLYIFRDPLIFFCHYTAEKSQRSYGWCLLVLG